ncbi:MAG: single-stranded-DNA-specific exonuclease RecJ [Symploca sp. SIO1B1]|nr:single-stranded-DNA-specific exonuclease RecJ [Symploca sp. SIO1C2]NER96449.1 single-stranded-DNA-specific exonuclease RecJ [Symploca sp. SIO1B1]
MSDPQPQWKLQPTPQVPQWFTEVVKTYTPNTDGHYAAQLLWQREIRDTQQLAGFLNPEYYQPASPFEFGQEMKWAVQRLKQAGIAGEKVAIWGDFDADGITSTSVLWEGLGQFFPQHQQLSYYIPNRLTQSHGLNYQGIDQLAAAGTKLIVTCDTGSTNLEEIDYAQELGIDLIITDHHTLPPERPNVISIINPRYFAETHPLFHLSGVAVAYKLVEALYQFLPNIPQQPLEHLLDLVAIGLIADLVQLSGDCRYLAQLGIERLQKNLQPLPLSQRRPGVTRLLELCKRSGDRPTDISFGIGPRINAVSRIQGDATFCVELLTSRDEQYCEELALATELANTRRKSLQKDVTQQVKNKLAQLDLSTTNVIVLEDSQWPIGVLGLVAGQIAQEYGRPTILLSTWENGELRIENGELGIENGELRLENGENVSSQEQGYANDSSGSILLSGINASEQDVFASRTLSDRTTNLPTGNAPRQSAIARGSARSVNNIDLYELVNSQAHLLHRFGGHPFAAGLSLSVENIPLFTEAINQQLRRQLAHTGMLMTPVIEADVVVTVADLGRELFRELKLLEPCGMGNPIPKLLIKNCWFEAVSNRNIKDSKGRKVQYIKTELEIWDDSTDNGFPGIWWGHYRDEVPKGRCHAVVELDYNNYKKRAEVRIVALQSTQAEFSFNIPTELDWILDWRGVGEEGRRGDAGTRGRGDEETGRWGDEETGRWGDKEDKEDKGEKEELNVLIPNSQTTNNKQQITNNQPITILECPTSWDELQVWCRRAIAAERKLAIAYSPPKLLPSRDIWEQLVGIAKFLSRTKQAATLTQLKEKLELSDRTLQLGLNALPLLGFQVKRVDWGVQIHWQPGELSSEAVNSTTNELIQEFLAGVEEEQFRRQYFYQVSLSTVQTMVTQTALMG